MTINKENFCLHIGNDPIWGRRFLFAVGFLRNKMAKEGEIVWHWYWEFPQK